MSHKKTSGTETLILIIIIVVGGLQLSALFDGGTPGASADHHEASPW